MAYTDIDKPSDYFNTKLYTGNGSTQSITGVGFQPDWTWIKSRTTTNSHALYDAVRGATKTLRSNTTGAEATSSQSLTSFDSDGFSVGSDGQENGSGRNYASWNWKASNSTASNTDGTINTSSTSANTTAGFSISTYTGTGSTATVGHGLGVAPAMIIIKARSFVEDWIVYHQSTGNTVKLDLNTTNATDASVNYWQNTTPSSSVFYIGANDRLNKSGATYVAYCFAEKKGYSKFGSYVGNSSSDGVYVHLGFRPAWFMFKDTESTTSWIIKDNKRLGYNGIVPHLQANTNDAENTDGWSEVDFLSIGIKLRIADNSMNNSGSKFIYMAFAESPFVNSAGAVPNNAR